MLQIHQSVNILLLLGALSTDEFAGACDPKAAEIRGGTYSLLENGNTLMYECPQGQYPYPTYTRFCSFGREWSPLKDKSGRSVQQSVCQDIHCAKPLKFENGVYEPHQQFYNVNQELRFHCYEGYKLRGPQIRTCLPNGKWSGETAICDDGTGHCPNPGIPIGAWKHGTEYQEGKTVHYKCDRGLSLLGSKERVCQMLGTWSGAEPECRSMFNFDSKEDIFTKFLPSLLDIAVAATQGASGSNESDPLNIYLILDASRSTGAAAFTKAKNLLVKLIEKISQYDIIPRYGIVTFATESRALVDVMDPRSSDAIWVSEQLSRVSFDEHHHKPGTNVRKGLEAVYEMILPQAEEKRKGLNPTPVTSTTKHVIILLSDGNYNMGGFPVAAIEKIKELLEIGKSTQNPRDDYLDIFVFGSRNNINEEVMNELASHKPNERHSFIFKDLDDVQEAFNKSIDESDLLPTCGFSPGQEAPDDYHKFPWFAGVNVNDPLQINCKGVVVSEHYVLTAAHCFTRINRTEDIIVMLGTTQNAVAEFQLHPEYDKQKLQSKGIRDFYDYDVALIKLAVKKLPPFARPICLPCTAETTHVLRKPHPQTTCKDHEEELLYDGNIPSFYITNCEYSTTSRPGLRKRHVWIKNGEKKIDCQANAKKATLYEKITDVSEVVTERFLCTGGTDPEVDPNICEHDIGGPLLVQRRQRYIQLGVISWSVVDACRDGFSLLCDTGPQKEILPPYARDFHINIFKILPWLKEQLAEEDLHFL